MNSQIYQHIPEKAATVTEQEGQLYILSLGHKRKGHSNWFYLHCEAKLKGCHQWLSPPVLWHPSQPHKKVTENKKLSTSMPFYYLLYLSSLGSNTYHKSQWKKLMNWKQKKGLRGGKGARAEKRGVLFLQTITSTMTAWLAPSPLTGNFCKRIMWCWNTKLQMFIYETGYRSDMGPANKVKRPVLSSAFQILKS